MKLRKVSHRSGDYRVRQGRLSASSLLIVPYPLLIEPTLVQELVQDVLVVLVLQVLRDTVNGVREQVEDTLDNHIENCGVVLMFDAHIFLL